MMFHEPHHGRWHQRLGRIRKCMGEDYGRILNFGAGPAVLPLEVVGVRTKNRVALTFHPELSDNPNFHIWLLEISKEYKSEMI